MKFNPADNIQDLQYFGEFGGVNPSISDSSTYTFLAAKSMIDTFEGNLEGCYLYSRHTSPSNLYLGQALAAMEGTEAANVSASGMGSISSVILQLCSQGDHIISSRTIYGGTYAFLKNFTPKFGISTSFVDITDLAKVEALINEKTKILYCESVSNPLLEIADIERLGKLAKKHKKGKIKTGRFSLSGAKMILDGSPQAKTAWLSKPYHIIPEGKLNDYRGYPMWENEEEVQELITEIVKSSNNIDTCRIYDVIMTELHLKNNNVYHWAEKCQLVWREIPYFIDHMPNGYAIHIIRDPRSVLASFKKFTNAEYPLYLTAVFNSLDSLQKAIEQNKNKRVLILKYENVLEDKYKEIVKVWKLIGLSKQNKNIIDEFEE